MTTNICVAILNAIKLKDFIKLVLAFYSTTRMADIFNLAPPIGTRVIFRTGSLVFIGLSSRISQSSFLSITYLGISLHIELSTIGVKQLFN